MKTEDPIALALKNIANEMKLERIARQSYRKGVETRSRKIDKFMDKCLPYALKILLETANPKPFRPFMAAPLRKSKSKPPEFTVPFVVDGR